MSNIILRPEIKVSLPPIEGGTQYFNGVGKSLTLRFPAEWIGHESECVVFVGMGIRSRCRGVATPTFRVKNLILYNVVNLLSRVYQVWQELRTPRYNDR